MHGNQQQEADGQQQEERGLIPDAQAVGESIQKGGYRGGHGQYKANRQPED
jgi:hypothetical protein